MKQGWKKWGMVAVLCLWGTTKMCAQTNGLNKDSMMEQNLFAFFSQYAYPDV